MQLIFVIEIVIETMASIVFKNFLLIFLSSLLLQYIFIDLLLQNIKKNLFLKHHKPQPMTEQNLFVKQNKQN